MLETFVIENFFPNMGIKSVLNQHFDQFFISSLVSIWCMLKSNISNSRAKRLHRLLLSLLETIKFERCNANRMWIISSLLIVLDSGRMTCLMQFNVLSIWGSYEGLSLKADSIEGIATISHKYNTFCYLSFRGLARETGEIFLISKAPFGLIWCNNNSIVTSWLSRCLCGI